MPYIKGVLVLKEITLTPTGGSYSELDKANLRKLYRDMYEGEGKENPSMTVRLALVEEVLEKMSSNLNKLVYAVIGTVLAIAGQIILRFLKIL